MNEYLLLDKSEREALKCLIEGKAPFLKDLLSKDALVNVGLSSADPKGNTSYLFLKYLVRPFFSFFKRYNDGFLWLVVAIVMRPEVKRIRKLQRKRKSTEASEERSPKRRETSPRMEQSFQASRSDSDKSVEQRWEAILVTKERDLA